MEAKKSCIDIRAFPPELRGFVFKAAFADEIADPSKPNNLLPALRVNNVLFEEACIVFYQNFFVKLHAGNGWKVPEMSPDKQRRIRKLEIEFNWKMISSPHRLMDVLETMAPKIPGLLTDLSINAMGMHWYDLVYMLPYIRRCVDNAQALRRISIYVPAPELQHSMILDEYFSVKTHLMGALCNMADSEIRKGTNPDSSEIWLFRATGARHLYWNPNEV